MAICILTLCAGASQHALAKKEEVHFAHAHLAITTRVPAAQALFDHGLIMLYAFNIGQAVADFDAAAKLDPQCAMAYWGEAAAEVTDINAPADEADETKARLLLKHADAATEASPSERARISALEQRFATVGSSIARREAYALAMQRVADAASYDADAQVEAALAHWQVHEPADHTADAGSIGRDLARAERIDPQNFGARHLSIHYFEEIGQPKLARNDADFLMQATYALGESHLPHMAGHIYSHIGMYDKAAQANAVALVNDHGYFSQGPGPGQRYMKNYHEHVLENDVFALTTVGRDDEAITVARDSANVDVQLQTAVRLRRSAPRVADLTRLSRSNLFDLAVIAIRAHDRSRKAAIYKVLFDAKHHALKTDDDMRMLRALTAEQRGDFRKAAFLLGGAYAHTHVEYSDPPDSWELPVAETYGVALLRAGMPQKATEVFRAALINQPGDPRLEFGLAISLEQSHRNAHAARRAYERDWHGRRPLRLEQLG